MNRFGIGVRIDGHDVGNVVLEGGSIEYGRQTINEQPGAPTCQLTLFTQQGNPQNPATWFDYGVGEWGNPSGFMPGHDTEDTYVGPRVPLYIGAPVWVSATTVSGFLPGHDTEDTYLGFESRRFTGKVQAIEYGYYRLDVTCVATLEEWAHVGILAPESVPFDEEPDTDRVADLAGRVPSPTTLHVEGDPGPNVIPYVSDDFPLCLLPSLQTIADDCDGLLYQNREGNVVYRTRNWDPPTVYVIRPWMVDAEALSATLELGDIENVVVVEYGTGFDPRLYTTGIDLASQTRYGTRTGFYSTILADADDAYYHAETIIAGSQPAWHFPDVQLDMNLADDRDVLDVCALEQGHKVLLSYLPSGAPQPSFTARVLGWTEDLSTSDWVITMHLAPWVVPAGPVS